MHKIYLWLSGLSIPQTLHLFSYYLTHYTHLRIEQYIFEQTEKLKLLQKKSKNAKLDVSF